MSKELKDILQNLNPEVDQQLLVQYLEGKLSKEDAHKVEAAMNDDEFAADAMEGLSSLKDQADLGKISDQLNKSLHYKLKNKRKLKNAKTSASQPWFLYAVILILILCLVAYVVIRKFY